MIEIGRKCIKLAGRDAGKVAVIIDVLEGNLVLIDGEVRRRKCNINHLEFLDEVIKVSKGASTQDVAKALGIEKKPSQKKEKTERPKKVRGKKKVEEKPKKAKKSAKKEDDLEALAVEKK
ncbi:MAG: 50S ribosomal protein L14e [Nanoarchaeota archaeon]|nr:50S ribosomal protein L14e [Nanoarchaeota archaeon]MBU1704054.1 50S ribosomal protein L14e [Nanoarchaeota archaeon]